MCSEASFGQTHRLADRQMGLRTAVHLVRRVGVLSTPVLCFERALVLCGDSRGPWWGGSITSWLLL